MKIGGTIHEFTLTFTRLLRVPEASTDKVETQRSVTKSGGSQASLDYLCIQFLSESPWGSGEGGERVEVLLQAPPGRSPKTPPRGVRPMGLGSGFRRGDPGSWVGGRREARGGEEGAQSVSTYFKKSSKFPSTTRRNVFVIEKITLVYNCKLPAPSVAGAAGGPFAGPREPSGAGGPGWTLISRLRLFSRDSFGTRRLSSSRQRLGGAPAARRLGPRAGPDVGVVSVPVAGFRVDEDQRGKTAAEGPESVVVV